MNGNGVALDSVPAGLPEGLNIQDLHEVLRMYNQVTDRLQQSHNKLESEVTRLRAQLEQKNHELELKNRLAALGEMAAGMAHEIRNPLGGIQLYASTLQADLADRPAAADLARKISRQVRHLDALVHGILGFTQHVRCEKSDVRLADVFEQLRDSAHPALLENDVALDIAVELEEASANVDAGLLCRALLNLVQNAAQAIGRLEGPAKHPRGTIAIRRFATEPTVHASIALEVADDGPGIPPEMLDKIFNPFFTTRDAGTGLGLAIVHRVVEAHGGRMEVASVVGEGTRFRLYL